MALPDYAALSTGTAVIFAHDADYTSGTGPSANYNLGAQTSGAEIDVTDLAAATAVQSTKVDLGATWDMEYVLAACVEWETTPEIAAGETLDYYIGYSHSNSAAVGNPANLSGTSTTYSGITGGTLANSLKQLTYLGSQVMDNSINTDMPQIDTNIATFVPRARYIMLVIYNNAASAALHSDANEASFRLTPIRTSIIDT
jgi:hypothetical protein